jgi:hypothetical protein
VGLTLKPLKQKSAFLIQEPLLGFLFGHHVTGHKGSSSQAPNPVFELGLLEHLQRAKNNTTPRSKKQ